MDFADVVARVPFLRVLPAADAERLRPSAQLRTLSRGQHVWTEGDPTAEFAFVCRGRVKLVKAGENGREVILELCGPGDLLCASAVCSFAPYCCNAAALEEDVEIVALPRRDVFETLERSPAVARAFMRELTGRGVTLCRRVGELASGQVEQRIATLLLRLADQVGVRRDGRVTWIPIPLSRQDLADLCGTTIETTIRVMTRLARESVVRSAARGLEVLDRGRLEDSARGCRGR